MQNLRWGGGGGGVGGWGRARQSVLWAMEKKTKKLKEIDNDLEIENPQSGSSPTIPGRIEIWKY